MTKSSLGGGDGDGEVRLLTVCISQEDWKSVANGFPPGLFGHAAAQKNGVIHVSGGTTTDTGHSVSTIYTPPSKAIIRSERGYHPPFLSPHRFFSTEWSS
jgi:hypothetical protein